MSEPTKILIVEDEAHMRCFLRTTLARNGYEPLEAADGVQAIEQAARPDVGLILLDLGLPDVDGLQVVSWVRERSNVPIIVLTARHFEFEKIETLDLGANDYVTKPFGAGELLARIRVALRQRVESNGVASSVVVVGELHLTPTEHKLLAVLARRLGRVVGHHEILREVWGPESSEQVETLRVFMRQLRYKLEPEPTQPRYLLTASGVGYRLKGDVQ
jgi:two-component system KDP operon response regulator KdpE